MAVALTAFDGATVATPVANPVMISAGDSLMWGQGLLPQNRFREIVRLRLEAELGQPVTELSLARSGARCTPPSIQIPRNPTGDAESDDVAVRDSLLDATSPAVPSRYSASNFTREIPGPVPTTLRQLESALGILSDPANASDPASVRLILLDGGINDTGIGNIIAPTAAIEEGGPLASWEAWIFAAAVQVRNKMIETLRFALTNFPNAAIVVNGYFPVFSMYSSAALFRVQALVAIHYVPGLNFVAPLTIAAAADASRAWQVASNRRLRQAIATVRAEFPGRNVFFARSGIERERCLFAPFTMLWDYDGVPDVTPTNELDVAMILAGITPHDEVAVQRHAAVTAAGFTDPVRAATSIMASVGHPNVAGARDYAESIIDALEFGGVFTPSRSPCDQAAAARRRNCQAGRDTWDFAVQRTVVGMETACSGAADALFGAAGTAVGVAGAALNRLAGRPAAVADCYAGTGAAIDACAATEATAIAACNATLATTLAGPCAIFCTQFTNCNGQFAAWDPRRYACQAARVGCVAAAATARVACRVAAEATRAACVGMAVAAGVTCRAAAVVTDTACATGQVIAGVADVAVAAGALIVAGGVALVGVAVIAGCRIAQAAVSLGGRLIGAAGHLVCNLVGGARWIGCRAGAALAGVTAATARR
ncbi:MAG: hypothetical protein KJZ54_05975 [Phycisphaerales bacterium]|nr:hypothetical protein [Phycisphaerales bacterium]